MIILTFFPASMSDNKQSCTISVAGVPDTI